MLKLCFSFHRICKVFNILNITQTCVEAPNQLRVVRGRPSADEDRRYRNARGQQSLYKAASRLWMKGMNIAEAIQIVSEAVNESMHQ